MSSGITFNDYREAREYQQTLAREGINSSLAHLSGKYVVTPKEKTSITMQTVEQSELGSGVGGIHWGYEDRDEIKIAPKSTTRLRLHEIGHAKADHRTTGCITTPTRIERELEAEIYAWERQGKTLNHRVGLDVLRQMFKHRWWGGSVGSAINEVSRRLEKRGIQVSKENKREFVDLMFQKTDDSEIEEWKEKLKQEL